MRRFKPSHYRGAVFAVIGDAVFALHEGLHMQRAVFAGQEALALIGDGAFLQAPLFIEDIEFFLNFLVAGDKLAVFAYVIGVAALFHPGVAVGHIHRAACGFAARLCRNNGRSV